MKKISDLTITVTYTVGLHGVEVSEKVYDALNTLADKGRVNCDLMNLDERVCIGFEWLSDIFTKVTLVIGIMKLIWNNLKCGQ